MDIINNITKTLKDDLSVEIKQGSKLSIAAACFSIYAFQELKELVSSPYGLRHMKKTRIGSAVSVMYSSPKRIIPSAHLDVVISRKLMKVASRRKFRC